MPLVNVHCINKSILRIPGMVDDIQEMTQWMADILDINGRSRIQVILSSGRARGRTHGSATWPYKCADGQFELHLNIATILGHSITSNIDTLTGAWHTKRRQLMSTLAHELIHVQQYSEGRLDADFHESCGRKVYYRKWMGKEWDGAKGATYKSYRHLPWEVEAFDNQGRYMEGFFQRQRANTADAAEFRASIARKSINRCLPGLEMGLCPHRNKPLNIIEVRTHIMNTIVNHVTKVSVNFDHTYSVSSVLTLLKEAGAKIGRTSIAKLMKGDVDVACGFEVMRGTDVNNLVVPASIVDDMVDELDQVEEDLFGTVTIDDRADLAADKVAIVEEAVAAVPVTVEVKPEVKPEVAAPKTESKASKAKAIFDEMFGKAKPAEIKKAFEAQAGMTKPGASTYYYKFKKQAEA